MQLPHVIDVVTEPTFREMLEQGFEANLRVTYIESSPSFDELVWEMRRRYQEATGSKLYVTGIGGDGASFTVAFRLRPYGKLLRSSEEETSAPKNNDR